MMNSILKIRILSRFGKDLIATSNLTNEHLIAVRQMTSYKNKFYWKPERRKANPRPKFPIILLEDDENLGRKGEVVKVERGYARHQLIPEGKADYAIKENLERYGCSTGSEATARASLKFVKKLQNMNLKLARRSDESWEISKHHISLAYKNRYKLHVPVHCIDTDFEAISEFGDYVVNITVNGETTVPVNITVHEWEPVYEKGWKEILAGENEEGEEEETTG